MRIPISMPTRQNEPRCPHCGKIEQRVEICGWCRKEYTLDKAAINTPELIVIGLVLLIFIGLILYDVSFG